MYSAVFMIYLALLSMLGFLATDMYLPAFGVMQPEYFPCRICLRATGMGTSFRPHRAQAGTVDGPESVCCRLCRHALG